MPITDTYLVMQAAEAERVTTQLTVSDEYMRLTVMAGVQAQFTLRVQLKKETLGPWMNTYHIKSMIENLTLFTEALKAHLQGLEALEEEIIERGSVQ